MKPVSADDSVGFPCESRTLPDLYISPCRLFYRGFFYVYASSAIAPSMALPSASMLTCAGEHTQHTPQGGTEVHVATVRRHRGNRQIYILRPCKSILTGPFLCLSLMYLRTYTISIGFLFMAYFSKRMLIVTACFF